MITKHLNGYVGYGSSEEEAINSCEVISVLKNPTNIIGFNGLEDRRNELSPWAPKANTLHIHDVGYIKHYNGMLLVNDIGVRVTTSIFEMLYKCFSNYISMVDVSLCAIELQDFFKLNNIKVGKLSNYDQVVPDDIDLDGDISVESYIVLEEYSIIMFNINKVAVKRNSEELFWSCTYNDKVSSLLDTIYYIAYVRGYNDIHTLLKGE